MWEMTFELHKAMLGEPDSILTASFGSISRVVWNEGGEAESKWIESIELSFIYIEQPCIVSNFWIRDEYQINSRNDLMESVRFNKDKYHDPIIEFSKDGDEITEIYRHREISGYVVSFTKRSGKYIGYAILIFPFLYDLEKYPLEFSI